MHSTSQEAARLLRVLSDPSRKREIAKHSDGVYVGGAHFETDRFFDILQRAMRLAVTFREFDDQTTFIADIIRPRPVLPVLRFSTLEPANTVILDLNALRAITVECYPNSGGILVAEFPDGPRASWRIPANEAERIAGLLQAEQPGLIVIWRGKSKLQICALIASEIASMMHTAGDTIDVHYKNGMLASHGTNRSAEAMAEFAAQRR